MTESENGKNPEQSKDSITTEGSARAAIVAPSIPEANNHNTPTQHSPKHPLDVWTFIFAVVAATATSFAACFTYQQVDVARDSEQRQLRGYVYALPIVAADGMQIGKPFSVSVVVKNGGETPVYKVTTFYHLKILPFPYAGDISTEGFAPLTNKTNSSYLFREMQMVSVVAGQGPMTAQEFSQIADGKRFRIYAWGKQLIPMPSA